MRKPSDRVAVEYALGNIDVQEGDFRRGRDEEWRDPWVFPDGDGWHMLITARANHGTTDDRGVVGHARSTDLIHWTVQAPVSEPGAGFGHIEVTQVEIIDGRPVLLFSCLRPELSARHRLCAGSGGVWALPCESLVGPFDISRAHPLTDDGLYSGRLVRDRDGRWVMLAFHNKGEAGSFVGALSDPIPVGWTTEDGTPRLKLLDGIAHSVTTALARPEERSGGSPPNAGCQR